MTAYDTITEGLADLKRRGYTIDFNLAFDRLLCKESGIYLYPSDFEITEFYRFEGETDPGDENTLYALQSKEGGIKGVLLTAYGVYSEDIDPEMLQKLTIHQ